MIEIVERFNTERLSLRKPTLDDASSIYSQYAADAEVTKYLSWKPHKTEEDTKLFLTEQLARWNSGQGYAWVIVERLENKLIGMVDLRINDFRAECGYVLAKSSWGRGYMTEALIAVRNLAFDIPAIERFQIVCDVHNLASARVMEKAGFQKEGILRKYFIHPNVDNKPRDCFCYSSVR